MRTKLRVEMPLSSALVCDVDLPEGRSWSDVYRWVATLDDFKYDSGFLEIEYKDGKRSRHRLAMYETETSDDGSFHIYDAKTALMLGRDDAWLEQFALLRKALKTLKQTAPAATDDNYAAAVKLADSIATYLEEQAAM